MRKLGLSTKFHTRKVGEIMAFKAVFDMKNVYKWLFSSVLDSYSTLKFSWLVRLCFTLIHFSIVNFLLYFFNFHLLYHFTDFRCLFKHSFYFSFFYLFFLLALFVKVRFYCVICRFMVTMNKLMLYKVAEVRMWPFFT